MKERLQKAAAEWNPLKQKSFEPYLRAGRHAPLRTDALAVELIIGDRSHLQSLTTGEATVLLRYRGREGFTTSVQEAEEDLEVLQLQGSKQEGYRVVQGMHIEDFMADQVYLLATNPPETFRRITMLPPLILCDNLSSVASHNAVLRIPDVVDRYNLMIQRLRMGYSHEEDRFIVEVPFTRKFMFNHVSGE